MKKYTIALDIGATKILGASMKGRKVIKKIKKPTGAKSGKVKVIKNITKVINDLKIPGYRLTKIGIGFAGQIDYKKGIVLSTGRFSKDFKNVKLAQILKKKFNVPVQIDNDVKCFTLAEIKYGIGRGYKNIIGLTFGTCIGGAIIMDGQFWRGKDNTAGEVGYMKISGQWIGQLPKSESGDNYCWGSIASGRAWQRLYKKYNNKKADEIIVYNIVTGLLNLCYITNPEIFILGGGLMEHGDILPKIRKEFNKRASRAWFKKVRMVKARLGEEAILLGSLL